MHTYIHRYTYIHTHTHVYLYTHIYLYTCTYDYKCMLQNDDSGEVRFCLLLIQINSWMGLYQSIQNRQLFQSIRTRTITPYGKSYSPGARWLVLQ